MPTRDQVIDSLRAVIDPELRQDIVELEMVRSVEIHDNGVVDVMVSLTTAGCPIRSHFQTGVADAVRELEGVTGVNVSFDVLSDSEKPALGRKLGRGVAARGRAGPGRERHLRRLGQGRRRQVERHRQPGRGARRRGQARSACSTPTCGATRSRGCSASAASARRSTRERKLIPLTAHDGIKVMSIGFFVEQDAAVVWRGPMLHKALQQFLEDVDWGELDYLLIDLPPGTGDVSMTLAQLLPQAKFLIVTTPQPVAQKVARRSAEMAGKLKLEIAGVIENMSGFVTPDGERFPIFGEGGGQLLAEELEVPLLAKVPLTMPLREQADAGTPLVFADPDDPAAQAIYQAARGLIALTPVELPVMAPSRPPPRSRCSRSSRSACRCRWPDG